MQVAWFKGLITNLFIKGSPLDAHRCDLVFWVPCISQNWLSPCYEASPCVGVICIFYIYSQGQNKSVWKQGLNLSHWTFAEVSVL